ncbi:hypothetical protein Tco_1050717 [Tanacetum coccineum]
MAFMVAVNNRENSVTSLPFTGPEALGSLPQKRKKPKSKKTSIETKVTPATRPTEGSEQSHSVFSGNVSNPQDLKRNIQLTCTGLPSTQLDEGTRKSDPKDLVGNKQPIDTGLPSMESDNKDVFIAREEMNEDVPPTDEEARSPPPYKEQPESSYAQELDSDSSCPDALKKYDNILSLTERQLVKYLRKFSRVLYDRITEDQDQTDKLVQATMNCLDKNSIERVDLLKALNGVIETLKVVQEAVKDDPALNRKVIEATKAYTKNLTSLNELVGSIWKNLLDRVPPQSVRSSNAGVLDSLYLLVFITRTSQSRQHVDTSLIHIESRKSPTAVLFDEDTGRISIRHCEY